MLQTLARQKGWTYDDDAARSLSGEGLGWALYLPCLLEDGSACISGRVEVRVGGTDPIHCDAPGTNGPASPSAGSQRFARGLFSRPAADLTAKSVLAANGSVC